MAESELSRFRAQVRVVERYARGLGGLDGVLAVPWSRRNAEDLERFERRLEEASPEIVVVPFFTVLGYDCRRVARMLSLIFSAGTKEIHQAFDGSVITREDYTRAAKVLRQLALAPGYRTYRLDMLILELAESPLLSREELTRIYNAIVTNVLGEPHKPLSKRGIEHAEAAARALLKGDRNETG